MLNMTDEQRYSALLKQIGEVLQEKNTTISCQKWQIEELKEKLEAAEEERDFAKERLAAAHAAIDALREEIEEMKKRLQREREASGTIDGGAA